VLAHAKKEGCSRYSPNPNRSLLIRVALDIEYCFNSLYSSKTTLLLFLHLFLLIIHKVFFCLAIWGEYFWDESKVLIPKKRISGLGCLSKAAYQSINPSADEQIEARESF
jgi:hypothetical protein